MRSISCPVPRTRQRKLPLLISRDAIRYYRISHPSFYRPQPPSTRLNRRSSYLQQFKSSPSAHPLPHRTEADQSMVRQNQYTPPRDTFDMEQQTRQQSHQQSYRYQQPPPQSSPPSSSPPPSSSSPPPSSPPSTTTSFPHPPQHQKKGRPVLSKSVHPFDAHRSPSQKQRGLRNANGRFVFYDIETTGLNPKFDQILQFSAVLLDAEFNELDRVDVRSRLMKHVIPSPTALFVTNRSLGQIRDGDCMSQHELVSSLHKTLSEWSPAYFIGYNTLNFDEDVLRHAFFRSLFPPFLTQSLGNTRGDVMNMARATIAHFPEALNYNVTARGNPTLKLQNLAQQNGVSLTHAHDALSDIIATKHLAQVLQSRSPLIWDTAEAFRSKSYVINELASNHHHSNNSSDDGDRVKDATQRHDDGDGDDTGVDTGDDDGDGDGDGDGGKGHKDSITDGVDPDNIIPHVYYFSEFMFGKNYIYPLTYIGALQQSSHDTRVLVYDLSVHHGALTELLESCEEDLMAMIQIAMDNHGVNPTHSPRCVFRKTVADTRAHAGASASNDSHDPDHGNDNNVRTRVDASATENQHLVHQNNIEQTGNNHNERVDNVHASTSDSTSTRTISLPSPFRIIKPDQQPILLNDVSVYAFRQTHNYSSNKSGRGGNSGTKKSVNHESSLVRAPKTKTGLHMHDLQKLKQQLVHRVESILEHPTFQHKVLSALARLQAESMEREKEEKLAPVLVMQELYQTQTASDVGVDGEERIDDEETIKYVQSLNTSMEDLLYTGGLPSLDDQSLMNEWHLTECPQAKYEISKRFTDLRMRYFSSRYLYEEHPHVLDEKERNRIHIELCHRLNPPISLSPSGAADDSANSSYSRKKKDAWLNVRQAKQQAFALRKSLLNSNYRRNLPAGGPWSRPEECLREYDEYLLHIEQSFKLNE